MIILDKIPKSGWRRTGTFNVCGIFLCAVVLLACLLSNLFSHPNRTISQARIIFNGKCSTASRIDQVLHLFINVFSTCVLASSNFFMQVLSAPSRNEIDIAHRTLCALEIGVPSIKNIFFLSRIKRILWLGLFLTSVPIHLLFNSVVFETNFESANWQLTLATEAFAFGTEDFFLPGASLAHSGAAVPTLPLQNSTDWQSGIGYGAYVPLSDYWNASSQTNQAITNAKKEAAGWNKLTIQECYSEYKFCTPKQKYRDVVVVVDGVGTGWIRSEVFRFDMESDNPDVENTWEIWNEHILPNVTNSLWYSAACWNQRGNDFQTNGDSASCSADGTCQGALGDPDGLASVDTTTLPGSGWTIPFHNWFSVPEEYGFNQSFNNLSVAYCLAEPHPNYKCKVGVSNLLLLIVVSCVFIKVCLATITIWKVPHTSLVTLGDAMESFIGKPDEKTVGLGTLTVVDSSRIEYQKRTPKRVGILARGPRPRRWQVASRRFSFVISRSVWIRTYGTLSVGVALLVVALYFFAASYGGRMLTGPFGSSNSNIAVNIFASRPTYVALLLAANSPQIILSTCYFALNAFFTRIMTEHEWSSYSLSYKPLRVSYPRGKQTSTYLLQLPYKYSLPLLGVSMLLHWTLSNAIFLYIVEGGFWIDSDESSSVFDVEDLGVSSDSLIALGASGSALLAMTIFSVTVGCLPAVFSLRKTPGSMVSGGSNSLVLSAACHGSVSARRMARKQSNKTVMMQMGPGRHRGDSMRPLPDTAVNVAVSDLEINRSKDHTHTGQQCVDKKQGLGRYQSVPMEDIELSGLQPGQKDLKKAFAEIGINEVSNEANSSPYDDPWRAQESVGVQVYGHDEMSPLERLTLGPIKWGSMTVDPDLSARLNLEGIDGPVMHLGVGNEEDSVQPPEEGHWYV